MGTVREVLFGKVDLDTLTTALVLGLNPAEVLFRYVKGSANGPQLADTSVVAIEVGGSGRTAENNFDHHSSPSLAGGTLNLSACAQALERLARLVRYVDELDRGVSFQAGTVASGFPTLAQLISGMLLVVKEPEQRMEKGIEILKAAVQSGIDPYGCMEPILDSVPHGRWYAAQKRQHDRHFEAVCASAVWHTTASGRRLAVVETTWVGAPGALYGKGADLVVALNPEMELAGGKSIRKFTISGNGRSVLPALNELAELEKGWGGPSHGTIGGSPRDCDSHLSLEKVVEVAVRTL